MSIALDRDTILHTLHPDGEVGGIFVRDLLKAGFDEKRAKDVLNQADTMSLSVEDVKAFQGNFVGENGKSDKNKQAAFMHVHATKMTVDSYIPVLEDRADNADNHTKSELMESTVRLMHAHGFSGKEIANVFNDMLKISKSSTPHPTEGLSPEGIQLARNLVLAAEIPAHNGDRTARNNAIKEAIRAIAESKNFEAQKKSTMVDEMDSSSEVARIHNGGANAFDRKVEDIIFKVTGERHEINTNTAPRSWDYDADGKNNAEGFAMMAKIATTTKGALDDLKKNLDHLLEKGGVLPEKYRRRVSEMSRDVGHVLTQLAPVYERSREIVQKLAECSDIEKRKEMYAAVYSNEFENLFQKLGSIYDDVDRGKPGQRGLDFYKETLENLDKLRTSLAKYNSPQKDNTQNAFLMDESYRTLKRNGFALDKGQTRNNDNVYQKMMQNLFKSDEFWKLGILGQTDREHIEQKENGFLDLSSDEQWSHMQHIMDFAKVNGNRKKILKILVDANPLESASNGYPEQERAYIDRMRLLALFPKKFEESIISDAKKLAPERQTFFAEICGYRDVRNMALYEDPKNLAKHADRFNESAARSGKRNLETRQSRIDNLFKNEWDTLHIMRPASDAERNGGSFTRLEAMEQYREFVQRALKAGVSVQIMIGGGQSLNRFGGDVDMVRRIAAQELKVHFAKKLKENGKLDDGDWRMMKTATSILYTEQGRTKRYASATSDQVTDDFTGKATNVLQDVLDMSGKVDYVFIDRKKDFSVAMDALQVRVRKNAIRDYETFANLKMMGEDGKKAETISADGKKTDQLVLDAFADKAGSPNMVGLMNNGARAAAGKSDGSKKGISTLRAIGKDQWLYTMQSYHAGFYGAGTAMQTFHENLQAGYIQTKDISDLMDSPDWDEAIFSRNLIDAGRFNATHLFTELSEGGRKWDFDSALTVGSQIVVKDGMLYFNGKDLDGYEDITQEELYLCKIYVDRLKFLALTEAAASDFSKEMKNDLQTIIQKFRPEDGGLEVGLGENTKKKWPSVENVTLANHRKNAAGFAVLYQMEEDVQKMVDSGVSMKDIYKYYGDGDEKAGEATLRAAGAALRAGTLPHQEIKVMGKETYGIKNRTRVDMDEQITIAQMLNPRPQPEGMNLQH